MARSFNIVAQLTLQGPSNIKPVVSNIRRQLQGIQSQVNVKIAPQTNRNLVLTAKNLTNIANALTQVRTNAAGANAALSSLSATVNRANTNLTALPKNVTNANKALSQTQKSVQVARTEIEEFGRQSALAARRFIAFSVSAGAVVGFITSVKRAVTAGIEFERELVKVSQVTNTTLKNLSGLTDEISRLSTTIGVSSRDLTEVSLTLAQAGLSARDTTKALEALAKSALAPTFTDIRRTTEGAIAAMAQFNIGAHELEQTLGEINAVAGAFAVESDDLIFAIRRAGGAFSAAGGDLRELMALFTSVRATTRESAETIATGFRTIFTRIQRGETVAFLESLGIKLRDLEGQFIGPYKAILRISEALRSLPSTDPLFAQIVEELGGYRQVSKVIPLIQQTAKAQEALNVALKGGNSLNKDVVTAQQALAVQIAKVREEFLRLFRDVTQTESFRAMASVVLRMAQAFIDLGDALKPAIPLLSAFAAFKFSSAAVQFGRGFFGGLTKFNAATTAIAGGAAGAAGGAASKAANTALTSANTAALKANTTAMVALNTSLQVFGRSRFPGIKFATGGLVPGQGTGDTVPAMLTPGEYVIRKKAVEAIGAENLAQVNKYAKGGRVDIRPTSPRRYAGLFSYPIPSSDVDAGQTQLTSKDSNFAGANQLAARINRAISKHGTGVVAGGKGFKVPTTSGGNVDFTSLGIGREVAVDELERRGVISASQAERGRGPKGQVPSTLFVGDKKQALADVLSKKGANVFSGQEVVTPAELGTKIPIFGNPMTYGIGPDAQDKFGRDVEDGVVGLLGRFSKRSLDRSEALQIFRKAGGESIEGFLFEAMIDVISGGLQRGVKSGGNFDFIVNRMKDKGAVESLFGNLSPVAFADAKRTKRVEAVNSLVKKAANEAARIPAFFNATYTSAEGKAVKLARGGGISGSDTVPAMLTPGEYVINKKAAQRLGMGTLNNLNRADKVQGFASGGPVLGFNNGGLAPKAAGEFAALPISAKDLFRKLIASEQHITKNNQALAAAIKGYTRAIKQGTPAAQAFGRALHGAQQQLQHQTRTLASNPALNPTLSGRSSFGPHRSLAQAPGAGLSPLRRLAIGGRKTAKFLGGKGNALGFAALTASSFIPPAESFTKPEDRNNAIISGGLQSGIGIGAIVAMFNPLAGAIVGLVAGIKGARDAAKEFDDRLRQSRFEDVLKQAEQGLNDVVGGKKGGLEGFGKGLSQIRSQFESRQAELQSNLKGVSETRTTLQTSFENVGDLFAGVFTGDFERAGSMFRRDLSGRDTLEVAQSQEAIEENRKATREAVRPIAEKGLQSVFDRVSKGLTVDTGFAKQVQEALKLSLDDPKKAMQEFNNTVRQAVEIREATKALNIFVESTRRFGEVANAISLSFSTFEAQAQQNVISGLLTQITGAGGLTNVTNSQSVFANRTRDTRQFNELVRNIGGQTGQEGARAADEAIALNTAQTLLPNILQRLQQTNFESADQLASRVSVELGQALSAQGFDNRTTGRIRDFTKVSIANMDDVLNAARSGMGVEVAREVFDSRIKGFVDSFEQAAAAFEASSNQYIDGLNKLTQVDKQLLNLRQNVAQKEGAIALRAIERRRTNREVVPFRDELRAGTSAFRGNQSTLVGNLGLRNIFDPREIAARIGQISGQIRQTSVQRDAAARRGPEGFEEFKNATDRLKGLQDASERLQKGLENLADDTSALSIAQQRLTELETARQQRFGIVERLITADPRERRKIQRDISNAKTAAATGNFTGLRPQDIAGVLSIFRSFGENEIVSGVTGEKAVEKTLDPLARRLGGPQAFREFPKGDVKFKQGLFPGLSKELLEFSKANAVIDANLQKNLEAQNEMVKILNDQRRALNNSLNKLTAITDNTRDTAVATQGMTGQVGVDGNFAAGGPVPGVGNKDTFKANLTPGEFVVNKKAAAANMGLLATLNNGGVAKFQQGGIVAAPTLVGNTGVFADIPAIMLRMFERILEHGDPKARSRLRGLRKKFDIKANLTNTEFFDEFLGSPGPTALDMMPTITTAGLLLSDQAKKGNFVAPQFTGNRLELSKIPRGIIDLLKTSPTSQDLAFAKQLLPIELLKQYHQVRKEARKPKYQKNPAGFALGGTVPGVGNTDSIPALLTPGEFVLRKEAVKAIGMSKLNQMNRFKRMQTGGLVGSSSTTRSSDGSPMALGIDQRTKATFDRFGVDVGVFRDAASQLTNHFAKFSDGLNRMTELLSRLPTEISLVGRHEVTLNVVGGPALRGFVQGIVEEALRKAPGLPTDAFEGEARLGAGTI